MGLDHEFAARSSGRSATAATRGLAFALVLLAPVAAHASSPGVCDPKQPISGAALFAANCASCHGADAKGGKTPGGVAAPDLTALTRNAKGVFPGPKVSDTIRYGGKLPEHGANGEMPVWAKVFHDECGPMFSRRVTLELTKYVEGLQK